MGASSWRFKSSLRHQKIITDKKATDIPVVFLFCLKLFRWILIYTEHMPHQQKCIADLLSFGRIQELARPSDIRYGQAIHDRGGVESIKNNPLHSEAWVGGLDGSIAEGGSQRRRTQLWIEDGKLAWHCAGNPKNHQIFCKHCVALSLTILDRKA